MLSDLVVKNAKPREKAYKINDEKGMYLFVHPNGGRYFRLDYAFEGKRRTLAIGVYPELSLKAARFKRDEARRLLADGVDPGAVKRAAKRSGAGADSFEAVAREWGERKMPGWEDKNFRYKRMLERDIFPWLGAVPLRDVSAADVLVCLRRVEARGAVNTAYRTLQVCGQVFRYAVATRRVERDVTADLQGALPPMRARHFAAITEPEAVAGLLRAIEGYKGSFTVFCALRLAPLVFVRPGELRAALWADVDLTKREWRYLVTKTDVQHVVPLSEQAAAVLAELWPLTGGGRFVFPCERAPHGDRPMSENTLNAALRRLGYGKDEMTAHGFRAMARTILDEVLGFRPDFIEHQLAHAVRDPNGRAYNRTAHLAERRKMMQAWADYLDGLKGGVG